MIIILSPYTGNEQENYDKVYEFAEKLMKEGKQVFSPVIYGHIFKYVSDFDGTYKSWKFLNKFFWVANEIYILCLDNWENSEGLQKELELLKGITRLMKISYYDKNFNRIKTESNY